MIATSEDDGNGRINVWVSNAVPAGVPSHEVSGSCTKIQRGTSLNCPDQADGDVTDSCDRIGSSRFRGLCVCNVVWKRSSSRARTSECGGISDLEISC